ncbi:nitroreductase family protein [Saprospiraceae bacterium]|nr:nitroreductase family protein [Saprospiraceae bacterium]
MAHSDSFIPYEAQRISGKESAKRSADYRAYMDQRRSIRFFSNKPVSEEVIKNLIMAASTAPSGAHKQPWTFCAVSNPEIKTAIRKAAEEEEYKSYHGRMSEEWIKDLKPFGTDWHKEFLTVAPWLVIVFKKAFDYDGEEKRKNYYVNESVGIAAGILISAIHNAGLVTLTHTPSPMNFLQKILERPDNERPFLLLPIGYPIDDAVVPLLERKNEQEVIKYYK